MKRFFLLHWILFFSFNSYLFSQEIINSGVIKRVSFKEGLLPDNTYRDFNLGGEEDLLPFPEGEGYDDDYWEGAIPETAYVGKTSGTLNVDAMGSSTFTIDFDLPKGINDFTPSFSVVYNSKSGNGIAGYGWNYTGVSAITRIGSSKYYDGKAKEVSFSKETDKFSLDGQRLLLKKGVYGEDGSVYQTETFSKTIIKAVGKSSYGEGYGPIYFEVLYPNGTKAYYGKTSGSRSKASYSISSIENPNGLKIEYEYIEQGGVLYLRRVLYGGKSFQTHRYSIIINYKNRERYETFFVGGEKFLWSEIIESIDIKRNNQNYKHYKFSYDNSFGYNRLVSCQEIIGSEKKEPIYFSYSLENNLLKERNEAYDTKWLGKITAQNSKIITADLDGDTKNDVVLYPTNGDEAYKTIYLFDNVSRDAKNSSLTYVNLDKRFEEVFPVNILTHNGTLPTYQGIATVTKSRDSLSFSTFFKGMASPLYFQYKKTWELPQYTEDVFCGSYEEFVDYNGEFSPPDRCYYEESLRDFQRILYGNVESEDSLEEKKTPLSVKYISGDFNGDGLTDVMAFGKPYRRTQYYIKENCYDNDNNNDYLNGDEYNPTPITPKFPFDSGIGTYEDENGRCYATKTETVESSNVYFIELDRRKEKDFSHYAGSLSKIFSDRDIFQAVDINGDGKQNIVQITEGAIYVYEYDNGLRLLLSHSNKYVHTNYLSPMMGDFNGDGKIDFLIPTEDNSSQFTLLTNTGKDFISKTKNFPFVFKKTKREILSKRVNFFKKVRYIGDFYNYLIPIDINGDGKTDIVEFNTSVRNAYKSEDRRSLSIYENSYNDLDQGEVFFKKTKEQKLVAGDLPHLIFSPVDRPYMYVDFGLLEDNQIKFFEYNKNFKETTLLRKVTQGNIKHTISYQSMVEYYPSERMEETEVYTSGYGLKYPYINIQGSSATKLVSRIDREGEGILPVKQIFKYHDAISNIDLGFIGFKSTTRSNFFEPSKEYEQAMYTQIHIDPKLRGATVLEVTSEDIPINNLNDNFPRNYISYTTNTYEDVSEGKVFKLKKTNTNTVNSLTETNTSIDYKVDDDLNIKEVRSNSNGIEKVETFEYYGERENPYFSALPKNKITKQTIDGDTFSTQERWEYGEKGLVANHYIKGNGEQEKKESFKYDDFGNIIEKSIVINNSVRKELFTYDDSGRFLINYTDHEGKSTKYTYDKERELLQSETNPYGQVTKYRYDDLCRNIEVEDYLGNHTQKDYDYHGGVSSIVSMDDEENESSEVYDELGLLSRKSYTNAFGKTVYIHYEYDALGRKIAETLPSFESSSQGLSKQKIAYDRYGRVTEIIESTGKTTNFSYKGLSKTVNENGKTTTITKNTAGKVVKLEDPGGIVKYTYYGNGEMKSANYGGVVVTVEQDQWGRKTKLRDPSAGVYTYEYDDFGNITKETSPKGVTSYFYVKGTDRVERKELRGDHTEKSIYYTYNSDLLLTQIESRSQEGEESYAYTYDEYKRIKNVTEKQRDAIFSKIITYDEYGNVATEEIQSTVADVSVKNKINFEYTKGVKTAVKRNNKVIWQLKELDAIGNITKVLKGGTTENSNFTTEGILLSQKVLKNKQEILSQTYNFDAQKKLLENRTNSFYGKLENFSYDTMERLISWGDANEKAHTQTYDYRGRIIENSVVGRYTYSENSYQQISLLTERAETEYNPLISVSYTMNKSPHEIYKEGKDRISYQYNAFGGRSIADYGGESEESTSRTYRHYYSHDGSVEVIQNRKTGNLEFLLYVDGTPYSAPAVLRVNNQKEELLFIHRDYLGSIVMLTNAEGDAVEKRHFDAWGNIDKYWNKNGATTIPEEGILLGRGYTGHEHLLSVGLIHMNGRLYDPMLHRFLMPDNYVQDPFNTQNFNRYGYVLNNPLKYTDPNGEFAFLPILIGAAVGVLANGIGNLVNDQPFFKGAGKAALWGGISGALSFGVNSYIYKKRLSGFKEFAFQAFSYGHVNGIMSSIDGGNYWAGFLSGAVGAAGSYMGNNLLKNASKSVQSIGKIAFGAVLGGLGSSMGGGNFWSGLASGATAASVSSVVQNLSTRKAGLEFYNQGKPNTMVSFDLSVYSEMGEFLGSDSNLSGNGGGVDLQGIDFSREVSAFAFGNTVKTGLIEMVAGKNLENLAKGTKIYYKAFNGIGKALGAYSAFESWKNYTNNPTTGNFIKASVYTSLLFIRVNPIVNIGIGALNVTGADDYIFNKIGDYID